ncbi:MAG TPA: hypothetical protein DCZ94_00320 [Lentisphaeria bacterium]|nr:MAG: hypothetical protein A2X48_18815 [Lentisphaerae bacterium GWF2_49_21]HBC85376.1 hypothetical protein [Lentisphaeria bacterium]
MKTVTSDQMRELDRLTIESGTPGKILMERAGEGATCHILEFISTLHPSHVRRFVILAGKGNNGGDAYVVARLLSEKTSLPVKIFSTCSSNELSGDAKLNAGRIPEGISCEFRSEMNKKDFSDGDIIIDGLLGTGISGLLRKPYKQWIEAVNASGKPVISLDIPSGLNGDDGSTAGAVIKADLTISIGLPKRGLFEGSGTESCGRLRHVDIGIPLKFTGKISSDIDAIFAQDMKHFLGRLEMNSHKGSRGHVLVIGGSRKYRGAPFLSGLSALRSGAGLATVATPENVHAVPKTLSLIVRKISDDGTGYFTASSLPELLGLIKKSDSLAIGPGMSDESSVKEMLLSAGNFEKPAVFDADALNIISKQPSIILKRKFPSVLTPHPGEMKRLLAGFGLAKLVDADRLLQARSLAEKTNSVIVLKGHRTVIASKKCTPAVNTSGSPALSTAGSGDVLSGMIASFIAQGFSPFAASVFAVFIHGLAGENGKFGNRGLIADDLPALIPVTMKKISPFA